MQRAPTSAVLRRLVALLVMLVCGVTVTPVAALATPEETGKWYRVGEPVQGRTEYLFQIALDTLGDGNRYPEIVARNRDQEQADGGKLTDPMVLHAGWVLELPADAAGPRVLTARPSAAASSPVTVAAPTVPDGDSSGPILITVGGLVTTAAMIAFLLYLIVSHRRAGRMVPELAVAGPALPITAGPEQAIDLAIELTRPAAEAEDEADLPAAVDGEFTATVRTAAGLLDVRLVVSPLPDAPPAYVWLPPGRRPASMSLPAELGLLGGWHLWIDLGRAPDLVTVTGDADLAREQARDLAARLHAAGTRVTVVGDALGDGLLAGFAQVPDFPSDSDDTVRGVVISSGLRGPDLVTARRLVVASGRRAAPILVGRVLRARWSMIARTAD